MLALEKLVIIRFLFMSWTVCAHAPEEENWLPGFLADPSGTFLGQEQPWQVVAPFPSQERPRWLLRCRCWCP